MKRRTVRSATLIGLAGGVAALALTAAPAASAAPAAPGAHLDSTVYNCDTYVAGGLVRTVIQRYGLNLAIRTYNISAPRAVYFDYDYEVALASRPWRGPSGKIPYHGSAQAWAAQGVFTPGSLFRFQVHDARGNTGGAQCRTD